MKIKKSLYILALALTVVSGTAQASMFEGETLDKFSNALAWLIIIAVPIGGLYLFWMVHILPEKIAHKRHHPQKDAIQTLCLLSLVFGGMLWPFAWLWAYTKARRLQACLWYRQGRSGWRAHATTRTIWSSSGGKMNVLRPPWRPHNQTEAPKSWKQSCSVSMRFSSG